MSRALLAGLAAGYGIAVPIGAVGTYLVSVSARSGVRRGAFGALGVASADALYAVVAVLGGAALASVVEPLARPVQLVSMFVLLGIAAGLAARTLHERTSARREVVTARAAEPPAPLAGRGASAERAAPAAPRDRRTAGSSETDGVRDLRVYLTFLGMTVLNPMTVVYFTALVLGGQGELFRSTGDRVAFVVAVALASASWQLLLATGGAVLGRLATRERGRLVTGLTSSALIAVLALRLL